MANIISYFGAFFKIIVTSIYMKVTVKVKTRSGISKMEESAGGLFVARLKSPAEGGKANAELIRVAAGFFKTSASRIKIKSGHASKTKILEID